MKVLTESNFILYAAANYQNCQCYDIEEFYEDLNKFTYLKKLFSRFKEKGELKERLILNHIITLYNIFEPKAATRMLFFKIEEQHWYMLKTFLLFLNYMPDAVLHIKEENRIIRNDNIPVDLRIVKALREL
jgi:hypothetical protein